MKNKKLARQDGRSRAFTLVEILVVVGIIAILIGLLLPSLTAVRKMAKEAQQKAQFTTIEFALTAFKSPTDFGDYPPSHGNDYSTGDPPSPNYDYFGAETLTEALVGWDLLGCHKKTVWRVDGYDKDGGDLTYDPTKTRDGPPADGIPDTLTERRGPYLQLATANVFRLGVSALGAKDGLFDVVNPGGLDGSRFVICDVFGIKPIKVGGKVVQAGTPILYYKASDKKTISTGNAEDRIYNARDNVPLTTTLQSISGGKTHPLGAVAGTYQAFYNYIADPKIRPPAPPWPSNPDSYMLISAGPDGLYGTRDDICNFEPSVGP